MSFLAVPPEVQQLIIDELLRSEDLKARREQDERIIVYYDLIEWSCVHSYFRSLLAPYIFKTVKLVNDEKSGASLDAVARSPHCVHVEKLHFIGSTPDQVNGEETHEKKLNREGFDSEKPDGEKPDGEKPDGEKSDGKKSDGEKSDGEKSDGEQSVPSVHDGIFPRSVDGLLSDLKRFPSLKSLSIRFDHHYDDEDDYEVDNPDEVLKAEAQSPWRALMCRAYSALSRSTPHVKHLDIRQPIQTKVSTFGSAAFRAFLGHLEQLTFSIHNDLERMDYRFIEWVSDATVAYPAIMRTLDKCFFEHLANVTMLSIKAPEEGTFGVVGAIGSPHSPLVLRAGHLPLLKTLHLEYAFTSRELIGFLVHHKETLEEVTLRDCYASAEDFCRRTSWSKLFKSLFSSHPAKLRRFEPVLRMSHSFIEDKDGFLSDGEEETVQTLLQDPGNIIFPYAKISNYDGDLVPDDLETWSAFMAGNDQRYWLLMKNLVDRNAMKVTKE
ncbi:acrosomal vesicle protein 1 [Pseudocyphellaria aurata]|nr:acrosomal vesicle protein 1 [Pseudocyphellaria aurata]